MPVRKGVCKGRREKEERKDGEKGKDGGAEVEEESRDAKEHKEGSRRETATTEDIGGDGREHHIRTHIKMTEGETARRSRPRSRRNVASPGTGHKLGSWREG
ncbi:hypothetical protein NDU88_004997 [Pleurodeles waltl]|uniref:Uncharacterized protein n=1 Tax=Pleurodeles waltl TaxID=8319 RepID=A0AAV7QDR7_PLEWA|nr:hypothetical protein NDU88_004997 [Pleurodeles waltl]